MKINPYYNKEAFTNFMTGMGIMIDLNTCQHIGPLRYFNDL